MDDDDFDRLIASLGEVLSISDDTRNLSGGLHIPHSIDVAAVRRKTGLSQAAFARRVGVSVAAVRKWEQGRRWPHGSALILLALLDRNPRIVEETLGV